LVSAQISLIGTWNFEQRIDGSFLHGMFVFDHNTWAYTSYGQLNLPIMSLRGTYQLNGNILKLMQPGVQGIAIYTINGYNGNSFAMSGMVGGKNIMFYLTRAW
jgi:hypothetical protein